jgi:hypothetical protein
MININHKEGMIECLNEDKIVIGGVTKELFWALFESMPEHYTYHESEENNWYRLKVLTIQRYGTTKVFDEIYSYYKNGREA